MESAEQEDVTVWVEYAILAISMVASVIYAVLFSGYLGSTTASATNTSTALFFLIYAFLAFVCMVGKAFAGVQLAFFDFMGIGDLSDSFLGIAQFLWFSLAGILIAVMVSVPLKSLAAILVTVPGAVDPTAGWFFVVFIAAIIETYLFIGFIMPSIEKFLVGSGISEIIAAPAALLISVGVWVFAIHYVVLLNTPSQFFALFGFFGLLAALVRLTKWYYGQSKLELAIAGHMALNLIVVSVLPFITALLAAHKVV